MNIDWKHSKLSKIDYILLFTGVIMVGMIFSLVKKQGEVRQRERIYKNKEAIHYRADDPKHYRAYEIPKEEKKHSDNWIKNLEKTHLENKEK